MSIGSNELVLYADNTGELYPLKQAILKSLAIKKRKGVYQVELGVRAWKRFADESARRYVKEIKPGEVWNRAFTPEDRKEAAKDWEERFRDMYRYGEMEFYLPEKLRARGFDPKDPKTWGSKPKAAAAAERKHKKGAKKAAPKKTKTRKKPRCPIGTEVQTLIFPRSSFSERQARDWARRHGYTASKVDETPATYRLRQRDPNRFEERSFSTIMFGEVSAVIGCPATKKRSSGNPSPAKKKKTARKKTAKKKTATKKKTARKKKHPKTIHVDAKRWRDANGNTYFSARIIVDGKQVHRIPFEYGYGDQYVTESEEWLTRQGYIQPKDRESMWGYMDRKKVAFTHAAKNVSRKKDL